MLQGVGLGGGVGENVLVGDVVQPGDGVQVPRVLAVVPQEGDRLGLSPVSDVWTVTTINEDLVISVSTPCNTNMVWI